MLLKLLSGFGRCQAEDMSKTLAVALGVLLVVPGCSDGSTTVVPSGSTQTENGEALDGTSAQESNAPEGSTSSEDTRQEDAAMSTGAEPEPGSREKPIAQGQTVNLDDGMGGLWEVTVGPSLLNANDLVAEENRFNDVPPEGFRYALLPVQAQYLGDETGNPAWDLDFAFVSSSGTTHKEFDISVVGPNELSNSNELYAGGSAEGNVVIAVPSEDIENGTWRIETSWGDQVVFFQAQ